MLVGIVQQKPARGVEAEVIYDVAGDKGWQDFRSFVGYRLHVGKESALTAQDVEVGQLQVV